MRLIRCTIVPSINRIAQIHHISAAGERPELHHRLNDQAARLACLFTFGTGSSRLSRPGRRRMVLMVIA